eukprot:scaffold34759_cov57-Cyclotella_meneghiniana.AAC.3
MSQRGSRDEGSVEKTNKKVQRRTCVSVENVDLDLDFEEMAQIQRQVLEKMGGTKNKEMAAAHGAGTLTCG